MSETSLDGLSKFVTKLTDKLRPKSGKPTISNQLPQKVAKSGILPSTLNEPGGASGLLATNEDLPDKVIEQVRQPNADGGAAEITVLPEPSGIKPHSLRVIDKKRFFHGGEKPKDRLLIEMGTKRLNLVERDFGEATDRIMEVYKAYKKAGLPVVNTFRKTTEGKVVMTDVTADGSRIYGKAVSAHRSGGHGEIRQPDPMDNVFLELVNNEEVIKTIKTETERLATLAGENGITLAMDDPFELVVHPDKTWNLLCLDLEWAGYDPARQKDDFLKERNLKDVSSFGLVLQRARLVLSHRNTNGVIITNIFERKQ